jgi:hypothetical protein
MISKRKLKKLLLISSFALFQIVVFLSYNNNKSENVKKNSLFNNIVDKRPLRNEIWEQINSDVFFKRSAAFYVIERKLLKIHFLQYCLFDGNFRGRVELELKNGKTYNIILDTSWQKQHITGLGARYLFRSLNFNFDLLSCISDVSSYDELMDKLSKFELFISTTDTNGTQLETLQGIDVNLKYINTRPNATSPKTGAIVCGKCVWFTPDAVADVLWYIEVTKLAGYKKRVICNYSIPNTAEFNDLFEKNFDFVEINQLTYLPDFVELNNRSSISHKYLSGYSQLKGEYKFFSLGSENLLCEMMMNECYLHNIDKYAHIAVTDPDEVIMPRVNAKQVN